MSSFLYLCTRKLEKYKKKNKVHLLIMGQLQERYKNYREPQKYMAAGVYPYFREITSKQMTEVTDIDGHKILDVRF